MSGSFSTLSLWHSAGNYRIIMEERTDRDASGSAAVVPAAATADGIAIRGGKVQSESRYDERLPIDADAGRKAALHDLMTAYGKDVWNFAYSMTRKWDQADDIAQEVFLKAYRNLHTFRSESSVKTWLLAITRNMVLDYRKSAFLRRVTLVDAFSDDGASRSAEHEVIETLAVNDMWKRVLALPFKYREVLVLFAHYQLSMKEMADLLGVSEGTVKSRLFHARKKLAAKGGDDDGAQG